MANSMSFNGTDLYDYNLTVLQSPWPLLSVPNIDIVKVPYGPAVSGNANYEPKQFKINAMINSTTQSTLFTDVDSINSLLDVTEDATFSFDNYHTDRYWVGRYVGGLEEFEFVGLKTLMGTLHFTAVDPIAYSNTERTSPNFTINDSTSFYVESTSNVGGNYFTNPVWILNLAAGVNSVTISNSTTNESLTWGNSLSSGCYLKIDSNNYICKYSNDGTNYNTSMSNVSGTFPRLKGGLKNSVSIAGVSNATLSLTYRARFL